MKPYQLAIVGAVGLAGTLAFARTRARAPGGTFLLSMQHGAFDGQLGAAVVIPPGYDATKPLNLAVYFHGFSGCVENAIADTDGICHPGGPVHLSSHLRTQFLAARRNAILVLPEIKREQQSGDPGRFRTSGAFAAFLGELLGLLSAQIGRKSFVDIRNISMMAHSGGYSAISAILNSAALNSAALDANDVSSKVTEICLLDALYGDVATFGEWARRTQSRTQRFVDVYTSSTAANSGALAAQLGLSLADTTSMQVPRSGVVFRRSNLSHNDVPKIWPKILWETSPSL